jgi:hypothetical protein
MREMAPGEGDELTVREQLVELKGRVASEVVMVAIPNHMREESRAK